ncbi:uncharacterized protein L201_000067 [Kwoniella dendrophila CBS 6074]|uniref:Citrate transporter-like domain-containing protein n=1 Tax=Kwoniella dendrophila CBS 6074 TaxID=1295534 RepID=A0AAX4JJY9_9TREE
MAITPLEDGSDRSIDARSIVTLITFFIVNALVIYPIRIPFPLIISRGCDSIQKRVNFEIPCEREEKELPSRTTSVYSSTEPEGIVNSEPQDQVLDNSNSNSNGNGDGHDGAISDSNTENITSDDNDNNDRTLTKADNPAPRPTTANENDANNVQSIDRTKKEKSSSPIPCARRCKCKRLYFPLDLRTVPVIGVLLLLASTCTPPPVVRRGIVGSGGVKPYDIMTLFICFAYISISLDCTGTLRYLAFLIASKSTKKGGGLKLYNSFFLFFSIIGLIFGNDPIILSGTPFLAYFTQHSSINPPTSFLFTHFFLSNLVSTLLVSSNITNLVLTSAFKISFLTYSAWLALPTLISLISLYPLLRFGVFKKKGLIPKTIYPPNINPKEALIDPFGAIYNSSIFIIAIIALIGLSAGHLLEGTEGVWTVTLPAALLVLIRDLVKDQLEIRRTSGKRKGTKIWSEKNEINQGNFAQNSNGDMARNGIKDEKVNEFKEVIPFNPLSPFTKNFPTTSIIISRLPWALLPFTFSFFILVEGLQHTGWIKVFGNWWGKWEPIGGVAGSVWLMGILSIIGCNIFGTNIGATILLARVLQYWGMTRTVSERSLYGAVFTLAVGSNFGAYSFVFSASLAGLLWKSILAQKGIHIKLREFIKWNFWPICVTMLVGCLVVAGEVCVIYKT